MTRKFTFLFILALVFTCIYSFHICSLSSKPNPINIEMISHVKGFNRLGRAADQRKALLRSLTTAALKYGRIRTTLTRAKALRKPVDHMITLAKKGTLHHRRQALAYIYDESLVTSLFNQVPNRYGDRNGGYCRIIRDQNPRMGDNAKMVFFELV